jgi:peptidoglycan/xylan/chitin deacetylase (PgdA/CDA1 family)
MKRAMLSLMRRSGAFAPFRLMNRHKFLILTYHRFSEIEDGRSTAAHSFAEQLAYLKANYNILPLSRIAELFARGETLPQNVVAVTIDDGFNDSYDIAFPLLKQYSIPATLYVVTDFVDRKGWLWTDKLRYLTQQAPAHPRTVEFLDHNLTFDLDGPTSQFNAASRVNSILKSLPDALKESALTEIADGFQIELPQLPPAEYSSVTWDQVKEMEGGGIEIGSHTITHPILPNTTDEQLDRELRGSRARLEEVLDHPVALFCYPNGSFDQRVVSAVAKAGYKCAVTTEPGHNDPQSDLLQLRRVPADLDIDHFVQSTSGFEEMKSRFIRG